MQTAQRTLAQVLRTASAEYSDHEAVVDGAVRLTYADLHVQVRTAARALATLGVKPGDRVGIWAPNSWHWVVAALATLYQGAVLVPLNSRYTAPEAVDIMRRMRATALVLADGFLGHQQYESLREAALETGKAGGTPVKGLPHLAAVIRIAYPGTAPVDIHGVAQWDDLDELATRTPLAGIEMRADAVRPDDVADILFTSGTTGRSKGACSAHRQTVGVAQAWEP